MNANLLSHFRHSILLLLALGFTSLGLAQSTDSGVVKDQTTDDDPEKVYVDEPPGVKEVQEDTASEIKHQHVPENMPESGMEKRVGH